MAYCALWMILAQIGPSALEDALADGCVSEVELGQRCRGRELHLERSISHIYYNIAGHNNECVALLAWLGREGPLAYTSVLCTSSQRCFTIYCNVASPPLLTSFDIVLAGTGRARHVLSRNR
jgi:hypothetical protein